MTNQKPLTNRKRGEFAVELAGKWHLLRANFANIALFEENVGLGIYELAANISDNKVKISDIVQVIYCFLDDKTVLTQDEIFYTLIESGTEAQMKILTEFLAVMFNVDPNAASNNESQSNDKKKK